MSMTSEEYAEASRLVRFEISRFYRRWGAAAAYEHADLMQIGLVAWIQCDGLDPQKRIAVRHDFFDLVRTSSGIRRKHKSLQMGLQPCLQAGHGYVPIEPIAGHESLSEPEAIVDLERRLTKLERRAPKMVQATEEYAYSGDLAAAIGERLGVTRANVQSQLYHFRQAVRT